MRNEIWDMRQDWDKLLIMGTTTTYDDVRAAANFSTIRDRKIDKMYINVKLFELLRLTSVKMYDLVFFLAFFQIVPLAGYEPQGFLLVSVWFIYMYGK